MLLKSKKIRLLSAYLDNELNPKQKSFVENKIKEDSAWAGLFKELSDLKIFVGSLKPLPDNPKFKNEVLSVIKDRKQKFAFLPVPKYLIPAASLLIITALVIFISFITERKKDIEDFLAENTRTVQNLYQGNVVRGDLYPVPVSLTNEDIFQFAVTGTIPVGEDKEKVFQFGDDKKTGHFFEVGYIKQADKENFKPEILYKKLALQKKQIDDIESILSEYRKNIETSILYSPKKFVAVDANVWNINKSLVYDIAKNMDLKQKQEFFTIASTIKPPKDFQKYYNPYVDSSLQKFRVVNKGPKRYIIMNPDTIMVREFALNYDSIQMKIAELREEKEEYEIQSKHFDNLISEIPKIHRASFPYQHEGHVIVFRGKVKSLRQTRASSTGFSIGVDNTIYRVEVPKFDVIVPDNFWVDVYKASEAYHTYISSYSKNIVDTLVKNIKNYDKELILLESLKSREKYLKALQMYKNCYKINDSCISIIEDEKNRIQIQINKRINEFNIKVNDLNVIDLKLNKLRELYKNDESKKLELERKHYYISEPERLKREWRSGQDKFDYYEKKHRERSEEFDSLFNNTGHKRMQIQNIPNVIRKGFQSIPKGIIIDDARKKIDSVIRILDKVKIEVY